MRLETIEGGEGPETALLIHSSGLSATQWRRHLTLLARTRRAIAPHLIGYGQSPPWDPTLGSAPSQDLAALGELVDGLQGDLHLVGHSYGGTLAARLALGRPRRFKTLALFEPVLLGLLRTPGDARALAEIDVAALAAHAPGGVAWLADFVDYWSGPGAFAAIAPTARAQFLSAGPKIAAEVLGIATDQTPAAAYAALDQPALVAHGERTTLAGRTMSQRLAAALPRARLAVLQGGGHMAPLTQPVETCALLEALWAAAH